VQFRKRQTFHATRTFLLSPAMGKVKLMDVEEFITKFRNIFNPKPKVMPEIEQPRPIVRIPELNQGRAVPAMPAMIPNPEYIVEKEIIVRKTEPIIVLEKTKPVITTVSEPSNPLGRVVVVLMNEQRKDRWTRKRIKEEVSRHAWDVDGIEHEIDRLIGWEILVWQSNGYLKFYSDRVRIIEKPTDLEAY
jgi:hypothetical protein